MMNCFIREKEYTFLLLLSLDLDKHYFILLSLLLAATAAVLSVTIIVLFLVTHSPRRDLWRKHAPTPLLALLA